MDSPFLIVGWKEWVALPELDLPIIKAKIDTGAATSSLHAYNIKYVSIKGISYVRYNLHPLQRNKKVIRSCLSKLHDKRIVKSSSGETEKRPVIMVTLKIGIFEWEIELNLTNRDSMGMRMLIGREALSGKILVNSAHKFLHGKMSSKQIKEIYK
ncbi:MAG: RimK/LysX family protein [Candidatus Jidaibacter sp.]|jgi:ribosomal protein S6--L-glutamate ligase|nr:RimK/LysX family protein [Candidatus Jidaibacter sp.]